MSLERYLEIETANSQQCAGVVNNYSNSQINNAHDNATIKATQNNGVDAVQLRTLIDAVKNSIPGDMPDEDAEAVTESMEVLEEQLSSPTPKKTIVKNLLSVVEGIAGTVEFGAAVAALIQFVQSVI